VGRAIANEIRVKLTPQEQGLLASAAAVKPSALDAYLKGRDYLNHGINEDESKQSHELLRQSVEYFEQAVKIDPNFARAYAGLAAANHWMASSGLPELFPKSKEAAMRALQIDDTLAEAHSSLAFVLYNEWDWAGSEREYQRAIELDPNSGHHGYALLLSDLGRHKEAIREIQLAEKLNPLEIPLKIHVGAIYLFARDYDSAIEQYRQLLNVVPNDPYLHRSLGKAYMFSEMYDQGLAALRKAAEALPQNRPLLAWAHVLAGNRREANEILDESLKRLAKGEKTSKQNIALVYAALGDKDKAFSWLEKAYQERAGALATLKTEPALDSLRSDPRFDDLLRRIGLL
jgi:tetratricopeptide (TPR) repeat protein